MESKTDNKADNASTFIEDLTVNQDGDVRGGPFIGVGELQETPISKSPDAASPNPGTSSGRMYVGTNVGVF